MLLVLKRFLFAEYVTYISVSCFVLVNVLIVNDLNNCSRRTFTNLFASEVQLIHCRCLFVTARQRLNETVSNTGTRYGTATVVVCYVVL